MDFPDSRYTIWGVAVVRPARAYSRAGAGTMGPADQTAVINSLCSTGFPICLYQQGRSLLTVWKSDSKTAEKNFSEMPMGMPLAIGDVVATQAKAGHDVGIVSLTGSLVKGADAEKEGRLLG